MRTAFVLLAIIVALILFAYYLQKRGWISGTIARKILHIGAISTSAAGVFLIPDKDVLFWIVAIALPGLAGAVWWGFFSDPLTGRRSWGIFYFALVYFILLAMFRHSRPELVFYPMLVMALSDGLATVVGEKFGRLKYSIAAETRTIEGSFTFLIITMLCLGFGHTLVSGDLTPPFGWYIAIFFVSMFLMLTESLSSYGRDNLWVPLGLAYWLIVYPDLDLNAGMWIVFLFSPIMAAYYAYRSGWLQMSGAVAALLLGWIMLISPNHNFIIPALFFFVVGSILTKLPGKKEKTHFGNRSAAQVFSNGAVPVVSLMLYFVSQNEGFLLGFFGGFAAALSDTSSSEIGTRLRHFTFSVINGRRVSPGLSGGVSWSGLLVGLLFSMLMAWVVMAVMNRFEMDFFISITSIGVVGNLMDSVIGALFQVKYRPSDSVEWADEKPESVGYEIKGYPWITNDVVNLFSTGLATLFGIVLYNAL